MKQQVNIRAHPLAFLLFDLREKKKTIPVGRDPKKKKNKLLELERQREREGERTVFHHSESIPHYFKTQPNKICIETGKNETSFIKNFLGRQSESELLT